MMFCLLKNYQEMFYSRSEGYHNSQSTTIIRTYILTRPYDEDATEVSIWHLHCQEIAFAVVFVSACASHVLAIVILPKHLLFLAKLN